MRVHTIQYRFRGTRSIQSSGVLSQSVRCCNTPAVLGVYVYVCMYVCVCMYVKYVCMYVKYVCMYVCMNI